MNTIIMVRSILNGKLEFPSMQFQLRLPSEVGFLTWKVRRTSPTLTPISKIAAPLNDSYES